MAGSVREAYLTIAPLVRKEYENQEKESERESRV